jgi:hypothetical protein
LVLEGRLVLETLAIRAILLVWLVILQLPLLEVVEAEVFTVPLLVVLADQEAAVLTEVLVVLALAVKGLLGVRVLLLVLLQLLAEAVGALVL